MSHHSITASIELSPDKNEFIFKGDWTIHGVSGHGPDLLAYAEQAAESSTINAADIRTMDSAGALLFQDFLDALRAKGKKVFLIGINDTIKSLLDLVVQQTKAMHYLPAPPRVPNAVYLLGEWAVAKWIIMINFLAFVGESMAALWRAIREPQRLRWQAIFHSIDEVGYRALPIVALLAFLVGVVLTYQISLELESYNAGIFIIDITGMVILREFGPLITAIIAAGRTSTAFTAQIGTMKVNEEIDALHTMGVPPIERLVMPKIIGTLIALPLLAVWADIFGVLGSMAIAKYQLGINYYSYLDRFQHAIPAKHYLVGLVKVPVFAMIIAAVGCFQGFQVAFTADSVGRKTTQSAVQSIFLIIIADAVFSVIFGMRGI